MKPSKLLCATLVAFTAAATTSAFAQRDPELPVAKPEVTTPKTRAEVRADTLMAKKDGELSQSSHANPEGALAEVGQAKTRADVIADMNAAKKANGGWLP
jgi:hypothetical protein